MEMTNHDAYSSRICDSLHMYMSICMSTQRHGVLPHGERAQWPGAGHPGLQGQVRHARHRGAAQRLRDATVVRRHTRRHPLTLEPLRPFGAV